MFQGMPVFTPKSQQVIKITPKSLPELMCQFQIPTSTGCRISTCEDLKNQTSQMACIMDPDDSTAICMSSTSPKSEILDC
jgi:hypothetical protein